MISLQILICMCCFVITVADRNSSYTSNRTNEITTEAATTSANPLQTSTDSISIFIDALRDPNNRKEKRKNNILDRMFLDEIKLLKNNVFRKEKPYSGALSIATQRDGATPILEIKQNWITSTLGSINVIKNLDSLSYTSDGKDTINDATKSTKYSNGQSENKNSVKRYRSLEDYDEEVISRQQLLPQINKLQLEQFNTNVHSKIIHTMKENKENNLDIKEQNNFPNLFKKSGPTHTTHHHHDKDTNQLCSCVPKHPFKPCKHLCRAHDEINTHGAIANQNEINVVTPRMPCQHKCSTKVTESEKKQTCECPHTISCVHCTQTLCSRIFTKNNNYNYYSTQQYQNFVPYYTVYGIPYPVANMLSIATERPRPTYYHPQVINEVKIPDKIKYPGKFTQPHHKYKPIEIYEIDDSDSEDNYYYDDANSSAYADENIYENILYRNNIVDSTSKNTYFNNKIYSRTEKSNNINEMKHETNQFVKLNKVISNKITVAQEEPETESEGYEEDAIEEISTIKADLTMERKSYCKVPKNDIANNNKISCYFKRKSKAIHQIAQDLQRYYRDFIVKDCFCPSQSKATMILSMYSLVAVLNLIFNFIKLE